MTQPKLTSEEEKTLDAISHQLCGNILHPINQENSEEPQEKSANDLMLDEVMKSI